MQKVVSQNLGDDLTIYSDAWTTYYERLIFNGLKTKNADNKFQANKSMDQFCSPGKYCELCFASNIDIRTPYDRVISGNVLCKNSLRSGEECILSLIYYDFDGAFLVFSDAGGLFTAVEAGFVRNKNASNIAMKNVANFIIAVCCFGLWDLA
jgi:hypothetical protein